MTPGISTKNIAKHEPDAPYKLALENVPVRACENWADLTEATARLQEYNEWFGRLPQYESRALEKLGLQPDVIYIRSRTQPIQD